MNQDVFEGKWKELKGKIQAKWGKLTDSDIDQINGRAEELQGRLQQHYGYTKDEAKRQLDDFTRTLH